jgi:hypothetical protein
VCRHQKLEWGSVAAAPASPAEFILDHSRMGRSEFLGYDDRRMIKARARLRLFVPRTLAVHAMEVLALLGSNHKFATQ